MEESVKIRFVRYLFKSKDFPKRSEQAIADYECMEIAREIIAREDAFWATKKACEQKELIHHYENMKEFFIENFGNGSRFVENLQTEINVLKTGYRKTDNQGYSYYDDILRIREVFDLYE